MTLHRSGLPHPAAGGTVSALVYTQLVLPGKPEAPPANLPRETALRLLEEAILPEEQKNARTYRELSPATRPSRVKKDW